MKQMIVTLPEPCHENWEAMHEVEKGRFCMSCQKQVVDFSLMSDSEILHVISQSQGNGCGRFSSEQLNRPLSEQKIQRPWHKYFVRFALPALLIGQKAKAQMGMPAFNPTTVQTPKPNQDNTVTFLTLQLSGTVTDSLTGKAIPAASINIKGSSIGTQSGADGHFTLSYRVTQQSRVLIVSCIGYETQEIAFDKVKKGLSIVLIPTFKTIEPVVINSTVPYRTCTIVSGGIGVTVTRKTYTKTTIVARITDSLTGKNQIQLYPNPVNRGSDVQINMKKVQQGNYTLRLITMAGSVVQQQPITVPAKLFNFQWPIDGKLAAGNYIAQISNAKGQLLYNKKIVVL